MHEILRNLPEGSFVLDLGCDEGSFPRNATAARCVRLDRDVPSRRSAADTAFIVQADAASTPFASGAFAAIISNHSLEHFDGLAAALDEIGRIVAADGSLFVAVPDASTFTDRLYRWLSRGGGHVNPFASAPALALEIQRATGLKHIATRTLCSSLSFLNRSNSPRPIPKRLMLLGGGYAWSLFAYVWASRRIDRWFGTRTSVYGWALYFGKIRETIDTRTWVNVCIQCGSGCASTKLMARRVWGVRVYQCPTCGVANPFADDFDLR
jgi:SAM-dependent methyltransferase